MGTVGPLLNYKQDPKGALGAIAALMLIGDKNLSNLASRVSWIDLRPGEKLARRLPRQSGETYYFVAAGQLSVVVDHTPDLQSVVPPSSKELKELKEDWQFVGVLGRGDLLSDAYVQQATTAASVQLDCVADSQTILAGIAQRTLAGLMEHIPAFATQLTQHVDSQRRQFLRHREASRGIVQDFYLRHGFGFGRTMKVIELDRCIECEACEKACVARHGSAPRLLFREAPALGVLSFPRSCRSCVDHRCADACGFDAITISDDGEVVIDTKQCVGCAACQTSCPNDVIEMVEVPYGIADFPRPMPHTDGNGLSNVPGLYLVGEASGDALIKIAINSGTRAAGHLAEMLTAERPPAARDLVDVVVVGAGPAGLSAALTCQEKGLSYQLFDKGEVASTIQNFPRKKLVMAEPAHIPLYGALWLRDTTREELIEKWREIVTSTGLTVRTREGVTGIARQPDGTFAVQTEKQTVKARKVVLAVGTRGSPRKLGVDGEAPDRVSYVLSDPEAFAGKGVLVVGGGDSAVEAAMSLADVAGTQVALSYRRDSFGRIKSKNRVRLDEYERSGRVHVFLSSTVERLEAGAAILKTQDGSRRVPADHIFALLGAEPPTKFFEAAGITMVQPDTVEMATLAKERGTRRFASKCDHCVGHEEQACVVACPTNALNELPVATLFREHGADAKSGFSQVPFLLGLDRTIRRRQTLWAGIVGLASLFVALALGLEVWMEKRAPELSLQHVIYTELGLPSRVRFAPGSGLGLWFGIVGATLMVLATLYPLHSRTRLLSGVSRRRWWMVLHIVAGVLGPVLVTYHTAFKLDRWPTLALVAAWMVALSGVAGRFIQTSFRNSIALVDLKASTLEEERQQLFQRWDARRGRTQVFESIARLAGRGRYPPLLAPLVLAWHRMTSWGSYWHLRLVSLRGVRDPLLRHEILSHFVATARAERRRVFTDAVERSMAWWRKAHIVMTVALFAVLGYHVYAALRFMAA